VTGTSGGRADSAGVPWAGRTLTPQPFAGDDGRADPRLAAALTGGDEESLASVLLAARVLVPVVALLGDEPATRGPTGLPADKNADMAVATLVAPDGRKALPIFSSLEALTAWDRSARPVPVEGPRAALSAVADGCDALVVDPAGPRPTLVRRPLLWALAQGRRWAPPARDPDVVAAVEAAANAVAGVTGVRCDAGERGDLAVLLGVRPGLDADGLSAVIGVFRNRLAGSDLVAERVEGLEIRVVPALPPENHGNS
jgi:hypothetical protein